MLNLMHTKLLLFDFKWFQGHWNRLWLYFPRFEFWSHECLFHALDCSMLLLSEIAVLLGVYKLHILSFLDCYTDLSTILVFVCKNRVILAKFQQIDGLARWLTSFNYNHTPHAGTLSSTGHCWPTVQMLLCLSCASEEETFCLSPKRRTDRAATRNWPMKSNHRCFELMIDYLNNVESEYHGIRRTLRILLEWKIAWFQDICIVFHQKKVTNLAATLVLFKLHLV